MPLEKVESTKINAHKGRVNCIAVSDNGTVVSGSEDGRVVFNRRVGAVFRLDAEARDDAVAIVAPAGSGDVLVACPRGVHFYPDRPGRARTTLIPGLPGLTCMAAANRGQSIVLGDDEGRIHLYRWNRRIAVGSALPLTYIVQVDVDAAGRVLAIDDNGHMDIYRGGGGRESVDRVADGRWSRGQPCSAVFFEGGAVIGTMAGGIVWLGTSIPRPALTAPKPAVVVVPGGRRPIMFQVACVGGYGEAAAVLSHEGGRVSPMVHLGKGAIGAVLSGKVLLVSPGGSWTELTGGRGEEFVSLAASAKAGLLAAGTYCGHVYVWKIGPGSPIGDLLFGGG